MLLRPDAAARQVVALVRQSKVQAAAAAPHVDNENTAKEITGNENAVQAALAANEKTADEIAANEITVNEIAVNITANEITANDLTANEITANGIAVKAASVSNEIAVQ